VILQRADRCIKEGKIFPCTDNEGPDVAERYACILSLTPAEEEGEWLTPRPGLLTPGKRTGTYCTGDGWA
jgi:hypothetical protein